MGVAALLAVTVGTALVGMSAAMVASLSFQARYAAGLLPFVLLAVAVGVTRLPGPTLRGAVLVVVIVASLVGSVRSVSEQRTQAAPVADALLAGSRPGDVVAFCPDQLEPSVHRELGRNLTEVTFPVGSPPGRVNWTNYLSRVRASDPDLFARQLLTRAGPSRTVWLVWAARESGASAATARASCGSWRPAAGGAPSGGGKRPLLRATDPA